MTIKQEMLRVFQTVADLGSLALAADRLGRSSSAVSMMLSQFEALAGDKLFETDRKNKLTPFGLLVLEETRRANEAFDRSLDAIRRHARSTAGSIRIAAVPSATVTLLPEMVAAFRQDRPDVRFEISDADSASVIWRVQMDDADIGIVSAAPGADPMGDVIATDRLGIVCQPQGAIARAIEGGAPVSWNLLALEPLIANPLCAMIASDAVQALVLSATLEARNTTALLAFVAHGLGATVLPQSAVPDGPGYAFVLPSDPATSRELRRICAPDRVLSPVARAFWDTLRAPE